MDIAEIDPTLRAAAKRLPKMNLENRFLLALAGRSGALMRGRRVDSVEREIVRDGDLRLRVYTPARPTGAALLWIHGGGLVLGAAAMDDVLCGETALETGATIVSVDYGLAPKHRFPRAIDDCFAGWQWLQTNAVGRNLDPQRFAIGGQSAGGGLAASLVQRVHDAGHPLAAQWLFCPMLDDRTAADRRLDERDHLIWNNRSNLVGWTSYLGDERVGAPTLPPYAAAARRTDLTGLPPAWIYTSDIELFHDEDIAYARRLKAAGVDVELDVVPAAPHGFEAWAADSALAEGLLDRARAWLAERLRP
ncbi:acetyl esterase/lipase [Microbacterium terrae]|uniref:Carboxylesterase NlhH n=1 Tax=Microbacterium terrae TaxID=69369 RepID=A0A0M2GY39_9MICO|nr:alpha/beta hydrolase [Microbacterium terrae]KJL38675.1 Carboxylesterase NlhH [Microbacterium terrae]MBP1076094.1 acetyl esterase/lipase [Microbacterium terrae]GLJ96914.1 esterase [Microbacterium terrae]